MIRQLQVQALGDPAILPAFPITHTHTLLQHRAEVPVAHALCPMVTLAGTGDSHLYMQLMHAVPAMQGKPFESELEFLADACQGDPLVQTAVLSFPQGNALKVSLPCMFLAVLLCGAVLCCDVLP